MRSTLPSKYDSYVTTENFCHKYVAQPSQIQNSMFLDIAHSIQMHILDSKTPAEAGVLDAFAQGAYLTTRKPGRLAGALA